MKLPAIAVATLAVTAFVGGTAAAQVTMQPVPNPPGKEASHKTTKHHKKHHAKKHHKTTAAAPMTGAAPAAAPPATPPTK